MSCVWKKYYSLCSNLLFLGRKSITCFHIVRMSESGTTDILKGEEQESRKRIVDEDATQSDAKRHAGERGDKVKRRKVAMLISYSGQGYFGMQRNPGTKTIEEDLLSALLKSGFISEEAFAAPQIIQFQRAARTDKGVSAARQVLSLKLPEEANVNDINKYLPEQIRVFGIKRSTKGFNCKSSCDARTYSYTLPTFAFTPVGEEISEQFRVSSTIMNNVDTVLKMFEGTHNFHNFTSRKKPLDPSAHRYIMSFTCGEPFISETVEFCTIKIKGQSFMLHQIRKMIGLTIAVLRGHTTVETINKSWKPDRLDIPMAPGLGLVLEEVHYDRYNKRYGDDGLHESLTWDDVEKELNTFKEKFIYSAIVKTEIAEKSLLNWLPTLSYRSYDIRNAVESEDCSSVSEKTDENNIGEEIPEKSANSVAATGNENSRETETSFPNSEVPCDSIEDENSVGNEVTEKSSNSEEATGNENSRETDTSFGNSGVPSDSVKVSS